MSKGEKREEGLMSPRMPVKKPMKGMEMAKKKGKGKGGGKKGC